MRSKIDQELELLEKVLAFKADPYGFVHYAYPWGEEGTPLAKVKGPRDWQKEELERMSEAMAKNEFAYENDLPLAIYRLGLSSGRGPGKSALAMMVAHWHMSTHLGSTTTVAANNENQMRTKTFAEAGRWFNMGVNAHWFNVESLRVTPHQWLADLVKASKDEGGLGIDPKYWHVQGQMWNPDNPSGFAGTHNPYGLLVLFDEASGIPPGVWDVTEGFFTEEGPWRAWLAMSQMRNRQGRFFELFNDPKRKLQGWRVRTISIRGMPGIDQTKVKQDLEVYGEDSDYTRVEIDGLPPMSSEDQFIPFDNVRAAQQNKLWRDDGEPLIMGVDPAPRGRTIIRFRQGRNGRDCVGSSTRIELKGKDNVEIANEILRLDNRFRPDDICIDFGMGTGVIDILKRKRTHGRVHEVKFGSAPIDKKNEWATHAIELWARVRDWLPGAMIPEDDNTPGTLSFELTNRGWRWSGKEDGKKILETKEDLKRRGVASPDDADALACTFEVNPPRKSAQGAAQPRVVEGTSQWITEA